MGVAAEAVVAGVERHGLDGGEVVRASEEDGDAARVGADGKARAELRDALSTKGSAP